MSYNKVTLKQGITLHNINTAKFKTNLCASDIWKVRLQIIYNLLVISWAQFSSPSLGILSNHEI